MTPRLRRLWISGLGTVPLALLAACILADAPPTIEVPPPQRPVIVYGSAVPALGDVIEDPRDLDFAVTVEVDSDQELLYLVLVDYFATQNPQPQPVGSIPAGTSRRTIFFNYTKGLFDLSTCHEITLIVALDFDSNTPISPKKPPGGDQVKWRYIPRGTSCQAYDAGPLPEAGADASDAGDGGAD